MDTIKLPRTLVIEGGNRLMGEIDIQGAKNSCLPILAASLLVNGKTVLHNCPKLSDVDSACEILSYLGCTITRQAQTICIDATAPTRCEIPEPLMHKMRSSIVFLGAIVSRLHQARLSFPGGCELGPRPIDLHLSALRQLGVTIKEQHGYLTCNTTHKLQGTKLNLAFPSVGATENIILAAVCAQGQTIINNAAQEPEIVDLATFLNACGARIQDAGKSTIRIEGVASLHGTEHSVMPDRIAAATYLCAAAITGGEVLLHQTDSTALEGMLPFLEEAGCFVSANGTDLLLKSPDKLREFKTIRTMPYPGFPTDAQAIFMACACVAQGTSMFVENIFESRYKHAVELQRMGADIKLEGKVAIVTGTNRLYGANVTATDLRGGAAMVLAALAADGQTTIGNIEHIDRGYESIDYVLTHLGAQITRR